MHTLVHSHSCTWDMAHTPTCAHTTHVGTKGKQNTSTFFFRPARGPRRGARTTVFFSGVKSWGREGSVHVGPTGRHHPLAPTPQEPTTHSPGHWSSPTPTSFPSSPPQMGTRWLDPGRWRPSGLVLRLTSGNGAALMGQWPGKLRLGQPLTAQGRAEVMEPLWGRQGPL